MILLPRDYDAVLPFARVDMFLDEDAMTAKFCEFNADGSSGMNENREITASMQGCAAYQAFAEQHKLATCDKALFPGWVDGFLSIARHLYVQGGKPAYCHRGLFGKRHYRRVQDFLKLFAERGIECSVYDVRDRRVKTAASLAARRFTDATTLNRRHLAPQRDQRYHRQLGRRRGP